MSKDSRAREGLHPLIGNSKQSPYDIVAEKVCVLLWDDHDGMGLLTSFEDLETLKKFHSTFTVEVAKRIAAAECPENVGSYLGALSVGAIESLRYNALGKKKD
jgi:hypothetical protein